MDLAGARIYDDGVQIGHDARLKIEQIVNTIKAVSPSSEVSMRLTKSGNLFEALLWGKANNVSIGVYKRGMSMAQVLENLKKRIKKDCLKALRIPGGVAGRRNRRVSNEQKQLELAG